MLEMTRYQLVLLVVLVLWPFLIFGLLFLMSRLESYVKRLDASTPEQAGIEPVAGESSDREVQIVFGDQVVGEPVRRHADDAIGAGSESG
jgi:hypothetical protein